MVSAFFEKNYFGVNFLQISAISFPCWMTDRVFRSDCTTKEVYEWGAKEVALSVVSGINCKCDQTSYFSFLLTFIFFLN